MSNLTARDGTTLYYEDWGDGRPVVLMGPAMLNSRMWEWQAAYLAEQGYRCVTFDRRGSGRSDRPWTGYGYDTLADDLAQVLQDLDLRDVTLVGYAVGGGEAVQYLARHGDERVSQLVLAASTTPYMMQAEDNPDGMEPAAMAAVVDAISQHRFRWLRETSGAFFGTPDSEDVLVPPEVITWANAMAVDTSPRAAREIFRTLVTTDQRSETAKVAVPTLIIHGDADQGAPWELCGRKTAELLPEARVRLYRGAPHGLFVTHAEQFNADLLSFLREVDG